MVKDRVLFENILIIGPSPERKGGIASVIKMYQKHIKACYFSSTNVQSTFLSFLFFPIRLLVLTNTLLFNKKITIVHIHGSSQGSFYRKYVIFLICSLFKKKIIYHLHSGRFDKFYLNSNKFLRKRVNHLINNVNAVIVLSKVWENYLVDEFNPQKVFVLGNMIPEPQNYSQKPKNRSNEPIVFAYLGKIFQPKGVYDLLDCIIENYDELKYKSNFVFAGNGDEDKTERYKSKDSYNIINFVGWLGEEEKNNLLKRMDVLILPSYSEGLPVSVLEAMSYKKGIITTNVGGIPEIVKNNFNGKMIVPGNKKELYEVISYYLQNNEVVGQHGDNGFEIAKDYFPEAVVSKLKNIYNSI